MRLDVTGNISTDSNRTIKISNLSFISNKIPNLESRAEIDGPLEKYIKPGSTLKLTCRVLQSIESPLFLFWYHNSRMINFDSHRGINVTIDSGNANLSPSI